ncbi:hypothetical protein VaNZ11_002053 [Volvox africanus]|uniref:EF-hand domain-containing protein n=1 Tax=Volvox africanus TaxID=51714 RepID=A0ABQ5RR27_9CHLO|nr:hypothetical protein VaNZ11_002053 [Volvox africanus]
MGCAGSRTAVFVKESPLTEALERKLVEAVISTKRRKSFVVKKSSFNNLMLQMPKLTAGFKTIREAYVAICGPSGKVTWGTFCSASGDKLGLEPNSESMKEVLSIPDVADGVLVSHPDLILFYTIIFLLDGDTKRRSILSHKVHACLDIMEKSFMFFDSSADGLIERKELAHAMKSGTRVFGLRYSKTLADRLFDQLDWSRDGHITFKEFLIGMERIIIETAGDDEEDLGDEEEDLRDLDADWDEADVKQMKVTQTQTQTQQKLVSSPSEEAAGCRKPEQQQQQQAEDKMSALGALEREPVLGGSDEVLPFTISATGAIR